mmetsp:Transcript_26180/g.46562  ORF Transcript_26180/g.46562 Transcript_26180/m.46562 type:complete len:229 (+) Transcript_26180:77-763(+)
MLSPPCPPFSPSLLRSVNGRKLVVHWVGEAQHTVDSETDEKHKTDGAHNEQHRRGGPLQQGHEGLCDDVGCARHEGDEKLEVPPQVDPKVFLRRQLLQVGRDGVHLRISRRVDSQRRLHLPHRRQQHASTKRSRREHEGCVGFTRCEKTLCQAYGRILRHVLLIPLMNRYPVYLSLLSRALRGGGGDGVSSGVVRGGSADRRRRAPTGRPTARTPCGWRCKACRSHAT